jgi:hypothetical protein
MRIRRKEKAAQSCMVSSSGEPAWGCLFRDKGDWEAGWPHIIFIHPSLLLSPGVGCLWNRVSCQRTLPHLSSWIYLIWPFKTIGHPIRVEAPSRIINHQQLPWPPFAFSGTKKILLTLCPLRVHRNPSKLRAPCFGSDMDWMCNRRLHVVEDWSSVWQCWEVEQPLTEDLVQVKSPLQCCPWKGLSSSREILVSSLVTTVSCHKKIKSHPWVVLVFFPTMQAFSFTCFVPWCHVLCCDTVWGGASLDVKVFRQPPRWFSDSKTVN